MQREKFSSTRSGGDALRQREGRSSLLQGREDRFFTHSLNAANGMIKFDKHGAAQSDWIEKIASCPIFYPTVDDFVEPLHYIQKIAPQASEYGICKVVPPMVASVPAGVVLTKEQTNFKFTTMIQPMRLPNWDKEDKNTFYMSGCHYTLAEYEKVANKEFARKFSTAAALPAKFIEAEFWKELVSGKTCSVEYANDVDGSAFSNSCMDPLGQSKWNLKKISRLPDSMLRLLNIAIPGVTEPMLYIGMLFSMFAWHVEDHYMYSINYHHCGAPKTWYGVPGKSAPDFEKIVEKHVYQTELLKDSGKGSHYDFLLQKTTMFAPKLLSEHGVPVFRAIQNPGEFVITFPRAYHAGFSHGFNCGEAVNFAMADWFPFGAVACLRYEFLNRMPLLPHEELLCKEATLVSAEVSFPSGSQMYKQQRHVKIAFIALMRSHLQAQEDLKNRGAKAITSSFMNVCCGLCKHACYIAYSRCSCYSEPTCLNHDHFFGGCTCGNLRSLVVREDLPKLQAVARMFELDNEISNEAMREPSIHDTFVANADIGIHEEDLLMKVISVAPKEVSTLAEENPDSCEGSGIAHVKADTVETSLDSKQLLEDTSDSEAFRVKRRRVSQSCSRRFQVDEQDVELLIDTKPQVDLDSLSKERKPNSCSVFVRDVMNKLGIKGSKVEVIRRWQHCARRRGLAIKTKWVLSAGRVVEALSFKSCMALKQLLTKDHAWRLEMLMKQALQPLDPKVNSSCGTLGNIKPVLAAPVQKDISDGMDIHNVIDKKHEILLDREVINSSIGFVEKGGGFDGKHHLNGNINDKVPSKRKMHSKNSLGLVEAEPDYDWKQCLKANDVNNRMLDSSSRHPSRGTSFLEGLPNNSDIRCRKETASIGRLKIKCPTPTVPVQVRKCSPSITEDDAHGADFHGQKQLHSAIRNMAAVVTEKSVPKEQSKGRAQATVEANSKKVDTIYGSKKEDHVGGTMTSDNVHKKRGRECGTDAGLACAKEPLSDRSSAVPAFEHQKVALPKISSNLLQLPPVAVTPNSRKDSDTALCTSVGQFREGCDGTRGHVGADDGKDLLSQSTDHKADKLRVKLKMLKRSLKKASEKEG